MTPGKYEFYRSGWFFRGWRWRYVAANGNVIAISSESYKNYLDCRTAWANMRADVDAVVVINGRNSN